MRTRNGNPDPEIERELAAIDATLGGQPVDADLTELAELVLVLQDERPHPRPAFVEELDERDAKGFPRTDVNESTDAASKSPGLWSGIKARRLPLAFGTAASLLIVVTAVVSSGVLSSSDGGLSPSDGRRQSAPAAGGAGQGGQAVTPGTAPKPELSMPSAAAQSDGRVPRSALRTAGGGVRPDVRNRQQDRDAALVLATPRNEVEDAADGVIQVTDRYQGFVLRSNVSGRRPGQGRGDARAANTFRSASARAA